MAEAQREVTTIEPQAGYQLKALSSSADIVIGGGSAGAGKTYSLLLDPLRDVGTKGFGGVIFRRTSPQIRSEGGLWDTSMQIYPHVGAQPRETTLDWTFPAGPKIKFSHLEYEKNILDWQGSQIPFLGFDELTHFSKKVFFYMLSRNRSTCGVKPYVRATCNPDPESWVAEFIAWWIDPETGFPIPERDGVIRYFILYGEDYVWGNSKEEVIEKAWSFLEPLVEKSGVDPTEFVKSLTFVAGDVYGNKALLDVNPAYLGNLLSQDEQTRSQLLEGNWKVKISDQDIYDYYAFVGVFDNLYSTSSPQRYIVADIATQGKDKFVVGYFEGMELTDISVIAISSGKKIVEVIREIAIRYRVPNAHILFDSDGVGSFLDGSDGYLPGAIGFHGGAAPKIVTEALTGRAVKERYANLKTQCYYHSGQEVKAGKLRISDRVATMMYDEKMTVRQRFLFERKAIKKYKPDTDGKLQINPKSEQKILLGGQSPDMMDLLMMRAFFDLGSTHRPGVRRAGQR